MKLPVYPGKRLILQQTLDKDNQSPEYNWLG